MIKEWKKKRVCVLRFFPLSLSLCGSGDLQGGGACKMLCDWTRAPPVMKKTDERSASSTGGALYSCKSHPFINPGRLRPVHPLPLTAEVSNGLTGFQEKGEEVFLWFQTCSDSGTNDLRTSQVVEVKTLKLNQISFCAILVSAHPNKPGSLGLLRGSRTSFYVSEDVGGSVLKESKEIWIK